MIQAWIATIGVAGLAWGSFLNVVIDRLKTGQSIVYPPSHCESCGARLAAWQLIPVLSYLILAGKCHHCGAIIPAKLPIIELVTGIGFAFLTYKYGPGLKLLAYIFYQSLFTLIFVIDLERKIIPNILLNLLFRPSSNDSSDDNSDQKIMPNAPLRQYLPVSLQRVIKRVVFPIIDIVNIVISSLLDPSLPISFLLSAFVLNVGWSSSLLGGGLAFSFLLIPHLVYRGGMGGGDVKLAGLMGLALGFPTVLIALLIAVLSSGLLASFLLLFRIRGRKSAIPFGPFLSASTFLSLVWGQELLRLYLSIIL